MSENQDDTVLLKASDGKHVNLQPGTTIGDKYKVVSLIGSGGMGSVYRVRQELLGKEFALKVLDLHQQSEVSQRRFMQEARTASQLQHPNLVEVHDFGSLENNQPYLVMDLVEGQTLAQILKAKGSLPVDYVIALAIQVCFGLIYAHGKGVIHRDIKPGNIMVLHQEQEPAEGIIRVVDFGIAKITQDEDGQIQSLTKTGEIFGSPLYMSPEQCRGTAVDKRSDIYSLGCVIYECLTGTPPIIGDSSMSTMMRKLSDEPLSLKEASLGRDFPAALEAIVRKMIAIKVEDRYQDLEPLVKELVALQQRNVDLELTTNLSQASKVNRAKGTDIMQPLLTLMIVVASAVSTAAFDRMVLYHDWTDAPPVVVNSPPSNFISGVSSDIRKVADAGSSDVCPSYERKMDAGGIPIVVIHFPRPLGTIKIDEEDWKPAFRDIVCKPDACISLTFQRYNAGNPNLLKGLIGLKLVHIDFSKDMLTSDDCLQYLPQFPDLNQVFIHSTNVTKLRALNNLRLYSLNTISDRIPASEFLSLKSLENIRVLALGPVNDFDKILSALGKHQKVEYIWYFDGKNTLTPKAIDALAKIHSLETLVLDNCGSFGDADLAKLSHLSITNLQLANSGVTGKSLKTILKFKKLKKLTMTTDLWTKSEIEALERKGLSVLVKPKAVYHDNSAGRRLQSEFLKELKGE